MQSTTVTGTTLDDPKVPQCVEQKMRRMRFPRLDDPCEFRTRLQFTRAADVR